MSIYDDETVTRVGTNVSAECPRCEARYAVHRDGACPQCDAEMSFEPDYAAMIVSVYEGVVADIAERHAPTGEHGHGVCAACRQTTPLAMDTARDVSKANEVKEIIHVAEDAVEALGEDPYWVNTELSTVYTDAYYDACADPEKCNLCKEAKHGDFKCAHELAGETCPLKADAEADADEVSA